MIMTVASLMFAAEDRQQVIERAFHPTEVANVAPINGIGMVTEMVVGELVQPFQLGADGGNAGEISVEGGLLGVHRWLRDVIDNATMNALFNR